MSKAINMNLPVNSESVFDTLFYMLSSPVSELAVLEITFLNPNSGHFEVFGDSISNSIAKGFLKEETNTIKILVHNVSKVLVLFDEVKSETIIFAETVQEKPSKFVIVDGNSEKNNSTPVPITVSNYLTQGKPSEDIVIGSLVSAKNDILFVKTGQVFLGDGWYPSEEFNGQVLRWLSKEGEIFVTQTFPDDAHDLAIEVSIETGPRLGERDAALLLLNQNGEVLFGFDLDLYSNYDTLVFPIDAHHLAQPLNTFKFLMENPQPIEYDFDPRELVMRFNSIRVKKIPKFNNLVEFSEDWLPEISNSNTQERWLITSEDIIIEFSGEADTILMLNASIGPCLDLNNNQLLLTRDDGSIVSKTKVVDNNPIVLPIFSGDLQPGTSRLTLYLINPEPRFYEYDDRELNLCIVSLKLTDVSVVKQQVRSLMGKDWKDLNSNNPRILNVQFGEGWFGPEYESDLDKPFRWAGGSAQIFLSCQQSTRTTFRLLPGPEVDLNEDLIVKDEYGNVISKIDLTEGIPDIVLDFPEQSVKRMITLSVSLVPRNDSERYDDPRVLGFRIIGIDCSLI